MQMCRHDGSNSRTSTNGSLAPPPRSFASASPRGSHRRALVVQLASSERLELHVPKPGLGLHGPAPVLQRLFLHCEPPSADSTGFSALHAPSKQPFDACHSSSVCHPQFSHILSKSHNQAARRCWPLEPPGALSCSTEKTRAASHVSTTARAQAPLPQRVAQRACPCPP